MTTSPASTGTTTSTSRSRTSTATRKRPELTVEERAELRARKLTEAHDRLTDAVAAAASDPGWRAWLATAAKFRTYSANNVLLIAAQAPDATRVAGYRVWQSLNRQVGRGERGIVILAPIRRRLDTDTDTDTGAGPDQTSPAPTGDTTGEPGEQAVRGPRVLAGFTTVTVFDVSQTDGDPLPDCPQVECPVGEAPAGLWDALTAQVTARGYTVTRDDPAPAFGVTRYADRRVDIAPGLSAAMACHTLAHELGHIAADHEHRRDLTRGVREAEADGIAYLVGTAYGLPPEFTVDYVTGWTNGDPAVVRSTAARVVTLAAQLLGALGHTTLPSRPSSSSRPTRPLPRAGDRSRPGVGHPARPPAAGSTEERAGHPSRLRRRPATSSAVGPGPVRAGPREGGSRPTRCRLRRR